jgi:hypothetical protein
MSGMPSVFNISRGNPEVVSATILTMVHPFYTLSENPFKATILFKLWPWGCYEDRSEHATSRIQPQLAIFSELS